MPVPLDQEVLYSKNQRAVRNLYYVLHHVSRTVSEICHSDSCSFHHSNWKAALQLQLKTAVFDMFWLQKQCCKTEAVIFAKGPLSSVIWAAWAVLLKLKIEVISSATCNVLITEGKILWCCQYTRPVILCFAVERKLIILWKSRISLPVAQLDP